MFQQQYFPWPVSTVVVVCKNSQWREAAEGKSGWSGQESSRQDSGWKQWTAAAAAAAAGGGGGGAVAASGGSNSLTSVM